MDFDFIIADTNILIKLLIKNESYGANVNFLVKKNLTVVLLKTIATLYALLSSSRSIDNTAFDIGKMDDAVNNIYILLIKLAKYEPKLPIMSVRNLLYNLSDYTIQLVKRWIFFNFF
jgi:hypothetical protein